MQATLIPAEVDNLGTQTAHTTASSLASPLPEAALLAALGQATWSVALPIYDDLHFSDEIEELTGFTPGDFKSQRGLFRSRIDREDYPQLDDAVRRAMRDGKFSYSFRFHHADGSLRFLRSAGVVQRDRDGRPCRLSGVLVDISADEPVQPARNGDGFYRTVLDDIRASIVRLGPNLEITYCNTGFAALCRTTPAAITGRPLMQVIDPALRDATTALLARITPASPLVVEDIERTGSDGRLQSTRWSVRAIIDADGAVAEYQCVGHDISDSKRLKRALTETHERLALAIETMEEGFILVDRDGVIVEVNHRFREMYDISGHLAQPGARYDDFLRHGAMNGQYAELKGQPCFDKIMVDFARSNTVHKEVPLANGKWLLISQQRTADGGWVGIRTDLTAQKAREAELERAGERLTDQARDLAELVRRFEEADQTKNRFLAHMSHELRTPLNAVLGFTELMRTQLALGQTDRIRGYCDMIHQGGSHLLALINDILDLSRVESGRHEFVREQIDLEELMDECVNLVHAESGQREVAVQAEVGPDCRDFVSDNRALKQIILNLLSNALKFTPEGGEVCATWRRNGQCETALEIRDTGIGMSEQDIQIALDPFGQIDSEIARGHQGTGLGLPLVVALTEALGGRLQFASVPQQGTTVTVLLPTAYDYVEAAE